MISFFNLVLIFTFFLLAYYLDLFLKRRVHYGLSSYYMHFIIMFLASFNQKDLILRGIIQLKVSPKYKKISAPSWSHDESPSILIFFRIDGYFVF